MRWTRGRGRAAARAAGLLAGLALGPGCAGLDGGAVQEMLAAAGLESGASLDDETVVAGLKEALRIGAGNAVATTSRPDGFLGDPRIRIPIPEPLDAMASGLRTIGLGARVDELEVAMNRAAEAASGEAFEVLAASIARMSFGDARRILSGGDTEATDYFRRSSGDELRARFEPIVESSMQRVGLVRVYDGLVGRWTALPLTPEPAFDLRAYVTERGLDGLFTVLAEEERKIRTDPSARVTELLRRVFGSG